MPPTKQPMLPAPATTIGPSGVILRYLRQICGSDSRLFTARRLLKLTAAAREKASPCNRHTPPLWFARRGGHSAGDDDGLTRRTERNAARSARPFWSERAIGRRDVTDDDGDPRTARLQGGQTFEQQFVRRKSGSGTGTIGRQRRWWRA